MLGDRTVHLSLEDHRAIENRLLEGGLELFVMRTGEMPRECVLRFLDHVFAECDRLVSAGEAMNHRYHEMGEQTVELRRTLDAIVNHVIHPYDHPSCGRIWYVDLPGATFGPHASRDEAVQAIATTLNIPAELLSKEADDAQ